MIEGVILKSLVTYTDQRGFFREIFRFESEFANMNIGQLSHSLVNAGVVKAWHGHRIQAQWNYVVSGKIQVALFDNREESRTFGKIMDFSIGDGEEARAYYFPNGVLHGYKCLISPMNILYVTSGIYDLKDEIRIPLNDPRIGYDWKYDTGSIL